MGRHYIDNNELECELKKSQLQGKMTEQLAVMLYSMCYNILRMPRWKKSSTCLKEEMVSFAMYKMTKSLLKNWSPDKGKAFSYCTSAISNSFGTAA